VRSVLDRTFRQIGSRSGIDFAVRLADGSELKIGQGRPEFTLIFRKWRAYWRVAAFGHVGLLEAYFAGEVDLEGSLSHALAAGMAAGADSPKLLVMMANHVHEFLHANTSWMRAKKNAEFHYALGPEFYRFWLDDPLMLYTCAYWKEGTRTLEEAQRNKLEHVGKKVLLEPGDDVVDIGSGFGGFLLFAEEHFGVKVTGYNTTRSQVEHARKQIEFRRLKHTSAVEGDFRSMDRQYDKVVSIGCLEHAGRDGLVDLIRAHARSLKPGGLGVIHFIGHVGYFRHRVLHPQVRLPRRLDPEPCRRDRGNGESRPRDRRRREPAPPLRADARCVGRALRQQLGEDPRPRSAEVRRALPPHLARVLVRLRRGVPLAARAHASLPDRVLEGQCVDDELSSEPGASSTTRNRSSTP